MECTLRYQMSLQMALCEWTFKAWESGSIPLRKFLQIRCTEIEFCTDFDHMPADITTLKKKSDDLLKLSQIETHKNLIPTEFNNHTVKW